MKPRSDRQIAKIVTVLTGTASDDVTLATAFAAAKPFGAHVRAIFAQRQPNTWVPAIGMAASPGSFEQLMDTAREMAKRADRSAKQSLAMEAERGKVKVVAFARCEPGGTAAFVPASGPIADCLIREAPTCDLFVLPPLETSDADLRESFAELLLRGGRPLLLSPRQAPREIGRRIAIAWDNSLPAGHALSAAMPFLRRAQAIEVITVAYAHDHESLENASEYLALHGIVCTEHLIERQELSIGEAISRRVSDTESDLLVLGGYGHTRLREALLGGVTEWLSSRGAVPLLLMH